MSSIKKGLSLLLAIIMIFTMMPTTIFTLGASEDLPVMKVFNASSGGDFHAAAYYKNVYSVTFLDYIDNAAIAEADTVASWDISANGDGSVMSWAKLNADATATAGANRYDVFIGGDGGVQVHENTTHMFYVFSSLKEVNGLENLDTSKVKSFTYWFGLCSSLESLDLGALDTSSATSFKYMFTDCKKLNYLDVLGWDTSNVTDMSYMFYNCQALLEVDLSSFNTKKVTNMNYMFYNAHVISKIYVGDGWDISNVTNGSSAFNCCYALMGGIDKYDNGKTNISFATEFVKPESEKPKAKEYTVTYTFTGENIPENVTPPTDGVYVEGTNVTVELTPYVDGYIFSGWTSTDADITSGSFTLNNDVVITGTWTKLYKVEYKYDDRDDRFKTPEGAPELPADVYYKAGDEVDLLGIPYVDRHIFIGWYTEDADISPIFTMPANDVIIYGYFKIPVESIEILDTQDIILNVDDSTRVNVFVKPEDATIKEVVYHSSDESVVKIDKYNNIIAVGEGTATITVSSADDPDKKDTIEVTVKKPVTEITVTPEEIIMREDGSSKITVTVNEDATNKEVVFESQDETIVKVDEYGNITPVGPGTTTITVTSVDNPDKKVVVTVTVKNPVTEINAEDMKLIVGEEKPIGATVNEDATNKELAYEVENSGVAKVDSEGNVIAVGEGTTTVTITSKDDPTIKKIITVTVIKKYKVTYKYDGYVPAGAPDPEQYGSSHEAGEEKIEVKDTPVVAGYKFSGWETSDATVVNGEFTMPANDVDFVGRWTKINYYGVTYKYTGDIPVNAPKYDTKTYEEGTNVVVETTPYVEGYIFSGWTSNDADIISGNFNIKNDVVIVGNWTKINYYGVTYKYTGDIPANAPEYDTKTYEEGTNVVVEEAPYVEGYIFEGWSSEDADITSGNFNIKNDVVIVGKWTKLYNVTYKYEGDIPENAPAVPDKESYKSGVGVDVKAAPTFEGYTFSGWTTEDAEVENNGFTMPAKDVVIKGSWTKINYYGVTYKYTGDVPATAPKYDTKTYEEGTNVVVETTPYVEGYIFSGWSSNDADITSGNFNIKNDVVIVGNWEKIPVVYYTVTYKYKGEVPQGVPAVPETKTYEAGTEVTVAAYPASTPGKAIFLGWRNGGVPAEENSKFVINSNVEFVGEWHIFVDEVIAPEKIEIVVGMETNIGAHVTVGAVNQKLHYRSDNESVAKVDAEGNITANGTGTAKIYVTADANSDIYAVVLVTVVDEPETEGEHYMVFGKTEKIGWYTVSFDGGETWRTVFGNSNHVVKRGSEVIIKANDIKGDPFTFYINGKAVQPDENGYVRVTLDGFVLVGALGTPVIPPDGYEALNWFQQIIQAIRDFFAKIASWFKK